MTVLNEEAALGGITIQRRVRTSARVHRLMAAAIFVTARRSGLRLFLSDARLLADIGDVRTAIERLREELRVVRQGRYGPLPEEARVFLAAAMVVADERGTYNSIAERQELLGRLIDRIDAHTMVSRQLDAVAAAVEVLLDESAGQSQAMRRFLRGAAHTRAMQRMRIESGVMDGERRDATLARLDRLYQAVLTEAASLPPDAQL